MVGCLIGLALLFYFIGAIIWLNQRKPQPPANDSSGSLVNFGKILDRVAPNDPRQPGSALPGKRSMEETERMEQGMMKLSAFSVGERVKVQHPIQGEMTVYILGKMVFSELWQRSRGSQSPWVPTGNSFIGFWLENNLFVLEWQNRLYLLDEKFPLSDAEIQRDFTPHARKFAQSDQTAEVLFAYPPGMWRMVDIGKFTLTSVEGVGIGGQPGAVGRFIHAGGDGQRALVLEDYEGGGGQDTVWIGYSIEEIKLS